MPTIVHNPSDCCFTCDDFETCLEEAPTLTLTITGAPSGNLDDCCEPEQNLYIKNIEWNNTFQLDQDSPGSSNFSWKGAANCDDHGQLAANAVLIEDEESGTRFKDCETPSFQSELYINEVHATIACDVETGKMKLESVSFNCCFCSRTYGASDWNAWECDDSVCDLICSLGGDLQVAEPCTGQPMEIEVEWPTIESGDCLLDVTCETTQTGSIKAQLS